MRTLLAGMLAFLPLVQAQDSRLLKTVEPQYGKYSEDLATDFDVVNASVTITVLATGKPFALDNSSIPLPVAVVMALKDYEFRPQGTIPHGRPETEGDTYEVTLNVPVRQSKNPVGEGPSARRVNPGIAKGLLIKQVPPVYSDFIRRNHLRGTIIFDGVIDYEGYPASLRTSAGPFALLEAACDAVVQWQYRPYLLNGGPIQVLADIEVVFN